MDSHEHTESTFRLVCTHKYRVWLVTNVGCASKTGVIVANDDNNDPVESYQALLITGDPTGNAARIFHNVKDLTKEEFDRYSEAYETLEDILVTNMFAYFLTSAKTLIANWDSECKAFAAAPLPLNGDPDRVITLGFRLRSAVLSVCSALCYHQERTQGGCPQIR